MQTKEIEKIVEIISAEYPLFNPKEESTVQKEMKIKEFIDENFLDSTSIYTLQRTTAPTDEGKAELTIHFTDSDTSFTLIGDFSEQYYLSNVAEIYVKEKSNGKGDT